MGSDNRGEDSGSYGVSDLEDLEEDSGETEDWTAPTDTSDIVEEDEGATDIVKLRNSIKRLISIFEKAGQMMAEEDFSSKMDKILNQNKQIANGMIRLIDRVKELESKVESGGSHNSSPPPQQRAPPPEKAPSAQNEPEPVKRQPESIDVPQEAPHKSPPPKPSMPPKEYDKKPEQPTPPKQQPPPKKEDEKSKTNPAEIPEPPKRKGFFSRMLK